MTASQVIFCQATESFPGQGFGDGFLKILETAVAELGCGKSSEAQNPWALKIPLNAPGQSNAVLPQWINAARTGLKKGGQNPGPMFDTLSITTAGLDTAEGLLERASQLDLQEFFVVGDDPENQPGDPLSLSEECAFPSVTLSSVAAAAGGLMLLNSVRPHPHLGMSGALFSLGSGILDRQSKLLLHRDIRPTVDTPLCAGCGSCLATCIFDAITIRAGRAFIDHQLCTGCGECMTACHLAGISPEDASRIPRFQKQVAEAAFAVASQSRAAQSGSLLYANFLTPVPRQAAGGFGRDRQQPDVKGVLVAADPLALDQATWDILVKGNVHGLRQWSGFLQEPGALMERADALGLGSRQYDLQLRA